VSRAPSWKGDPERHAAITVSTKITEILIVGSILELKFFQNLFSADPAGGAYEASQGHVDGGEGQSLSLPSTPSVSLYCFLVGSQHWGHRMVNPALVSGALQ